MSIFNILSLIFIIIVCLSSICSHQNNDLCGKYAVLNELDHFYIGQKINKMVNLKLDNYDQVLEKFHSDSVNFKLNIEMYDSVEEINAKEPFALIPFTSSYNLLKANKQLKDFNTFCLQQNAAVIPIEPFMFNDLASIMTANSIEKTPVQIMISGQDIISLTGAFISEITDENYATLELGFKNFMPVYLSNKSVIFELKTEQISGFCFKPSNPWDLPGYARNKFLTTASKITAMLPVVGQWVERFKQFKTDALRQTTTSAAANFVSQDDYQLALPTSISAIGSFLSKYKSLSNWEKTIPSSLNDFMGFVSNIRQLKSSFLDRSPVDAPMIEIPTVDSSRLLAHLGIPTHYSISGPVVVKVDKKNHHRRVNTQSIPVMVSINVFDNRDTAVARLYQVKSLITDRKVFDIKYLITWAGRALAFTSIPSVLNCQSETPDPAEKAVKVCSSFQQAGVSDINIEDRTKCAAALLSKVSTDDIRFCPATVTSGRTVSAVRAMCEGFSGMVAVVSSNKPAKISVKCTETDEETVTYRTFPIKIQTACEVKLIEGKIEQLLLPLVTSTLDLETYEHEQTMLVVTPSSTLTEEELVEIEIERNNTLKATLDKPPWQFSDLFDAYLPYLAIGVSGFGTFLLSIFCTIFFIGKRKTIELFKKCCCSINYSKCFSGLKQCCKCSRCCKKRKKEKPYKIDIQHLELDELSELLKMRLAKINNLPPSAPDSEAGSIHSTNTTKSEKVKNKNRTSVSKPPSPTLSTKSTKKMTHSFK